MKLSRTTTAALLVTTALAVPCTAWWIAGRAAVDREASSLVDSTEAGARQLASRLAERLHGRLEGVRLAESQRPFFEYAFRYQDPQLGCECSTWIESPLARGPVEPLLWAHFEIDRRGTLTMPSVPPEDTDAAGPVLVAQEEARTAIEAAKAEILARAKESEADRSIAVAAAIVPLGDTTAWVEPFRWHTIDVGGEPRLVALRTVRAPDGSRVQGFVVSREQVELSLSAERDARFLPVGELPGAIAEPVGLTDAAWEVAVDVSPALDAARVRAREVRRGFLSTFFAGSGSAALAGLFVVGMVRQSERTARQRSRFAASAAHELRTPLTGLRLYGEMLADDLGSPDQRQDYARQIANEADRLARVVTNVLGYSQLERGSLTARPVEADLPSAVGRIAERLRPAVEANGATLRLRDDEPVRARFDPDLLHQICANLVDNAERYSREATDRTIEIVVTRAEGDARLAVLDRGPGVPRRQQRRLFEPFDRSRSPDAPSGLGLGLAIVASLARQMDGRVRYRDREGGGAEFVLTLPAA
ncbi:MAG: HAMP domain-containing sensor histidine kinase [bacterium]